jgi:uncharacterized protein (UPF0305 family)
MVKIMKKIEDLDFSKKIKKQELLHILRKEASEVHITDIMNFYFNLAAEGKYVQKHYKKEYLEAYVKGFILRIKEIKDNKNRYEGLVNKNELKKAVELLNQQEKNIREITGDHRSFFKLYTLISLYTTFILDEPIHMVGTLFPGGFRVKYENKIYYCPVKEAQKDNPNAVCGFCIAEQDGSV